MKNLIFLILFQVFLTGSLYGQSSESASDTISQKDEIYISAQGVKSEFPGGDDNLVKYLGNALLPTQRNALKKRIKGTVIIAFIINKEGEPEECRVIKGINPEIDEDVLIAVRNMPSWSPPTLPDGRVVKMQMRLPIRFDYDD